jgi:hypothetical protein
VRPTLATASWAPPKPDPWILRGGFPGYEALDDLGSHGTNGLVSRW